MIAVEGYSFAGQQFPNIAFFPLYPLLIRLFLPVTGGNDTIAALLVSHLALLAALILLYRLLEHDFDPSIAFRTLVLLLIFPTSIFFVAGYSESLALFFVVLSLWAIRRQRWWLAGVAGALLSLTRLPGVLIAPVLALTYLQQHHWRWREIRPAFLAVLLPPLGLASFMVFQWWRFDTPFAFLLAQRGWQQQMSPPWVLALAFPTALEQTSFFPITLLQFVIWVMFAVLAFVAWVRLPLPYGLTMLLLLPPYLSNQAQSLPRYVLVGIPGFVILALFTQRPWIRALVFGVLVAALVSSTVLFVNGFWIA